MTLISHICTFVAQALPFENLQFTFMQQAFLGLMLIVPMGAMMGLQVINFRMAFFSDAISHSTFTGIAIGIILSISPHWSMPLFGVIVGLGITLLQRISSLSNDTVIGVIFSGIMALGIAIVSRDHSLGRDIQSYLYGDILTITEGEICILFVLCIVMTIFQILSYNKLIYIALNPVLARAHRININIYQYTYSLLLSLLVVLSVEAMGMILVTAMLIVPAAAARNLSRSAGSMFWWAILISMASALAGLLISAEEWARSATGATIILVAFCFFILSSLISFIFSRTR